MGIDGDDYSRGGKRGVGFGGHVCRAGFLCETALGDFRVGDAIKNGTRQSRAPLRAVARTRAPAERPVSLDECGSGLSAAILTWTDDLRVVPFCWLLPVLFAGWSPRFSSASASLVSAYLSEIYRPWPNLARLPASRSLATPKLTPVRLGPKSCRSCKPSRTPKNGAKGMSDMAGTAAR